MKCVCVCMEMDLEVWASCTPPCRSAYLETSALEVGQYFLNTMQSFELPHNVMPSIYTHVRYIAMHIHIHVPTLYMYIQHVPTLYLITRMYTHTHTHTHYMSMYTLYIPTPTRTIHTSTTCA